MNSKSFKKELLIKRVIDEVVTNGGNVEQAIAKLNVDLSPRSVTRYAKNNDIALKPYKYGKHRYGDWVVNCLPAIKKSVNDFLVTATCTLCGQTKEVYLSNLRSGKSKCCKSCALKRRKTFDVVSINQDVRYSSISKFVKSVDTTLSYQQVRKQLTNTGSIVVADIEYLLIPRTKQVN